MSYDGRENWGNWETLINRKREEEVLKQTTEEYNSNVTNLVTEQIESLEDMKKKYGLQFAGESKLITLKDILEKAKTNHSYFEINGDEGIQCLK